MINREMKTVAVITYTTGVDSYGQLRKQGSTSRNTEMVVKLYSQTSVQDPRYVDCEYIGITADKSITVDNTISFNNKNYNILYVIPSGKYNQVLMQECK